MFKLFGLFSRRDWILLATAVIFIVAGVWMDLAIPGYLGEITDLVTNPLRDGTLGEVWTQGAYMLAFAIGSMLTSFIVAWAGALISSNHSARIRRAIYTRVGEFSQNEIKKFSIASLITRSTNDVTQVRMFVAMAIQMMLYAPILAVWAIIRMTNTSWELSLVTGIAVLSIIIVPVIIVIFCVPRFKKIQKATDRLNQVARENLTGIRVVRAYNAEEFEQEKFEQVNTELARNNLFVNRLMGIAWPFMALVLSVVVVAIYWVGSWIIASGNVGDSQRFFGDIMVFSQYSIQILWAFLMLIWILTLLPRTIVSAKRINEILATQSTIVNPENPVSGLGEAFDRDGTIEFSQVNFKYPGAEENVLSDINLKIKRGQTVAFIGGTGCGKSTLVNHLPRIFDPTCGKITIGGICIRDVRLLELNDFVGYIPQTAVLFGGTIRDNIAFGTIDGGREITDEEVERALRVSQSWDFVSKLDDGVNSRMDQQGKNFSGGQKQRLSIARVVARNPRIYVFDDTFSALDFKTDKKLRAALKKETGDATVIIVAQRIGTIRTADQIFVMDKGRIVGSGKHDELMKNCEVYRQIAQSQLSEEELR